MRYVTVSEDSVEGIFHIVASICNYSSKFLSKLELLPDDYHTTEVFQGRFWFRCCQGQFCFTPSFIYLYGIKNGFHYYSFHLGAHLRGVSADTRNGHIPSIDSANTWTITSYLVLLTSQSLAEVSFISSTSFH